MTIEELRDYVDEQRGLNNIPYHVYSTLIDGIDTLEQQPCEDCISRKAVLENAINVPIAKIVTEDKVICRKVIFADDIENLPSVTPQPKVGYCKDCKWWKDSDGVYRRDCYTESKCPMNRREVFEGNGYCYIFEPKMQEE